MLRKITCLLLLIVFGCTLKVYALDILENEAAAAHIQSDTAYVNQLLEEAQENSQSGEYGKAKQLIAEADSISRALNYSEGIQRAIADLADIQVDQAEYQKAVILLEDAVAKYPNSSRMFEFYNLLGAAYANLSRFQEGVKNFEKALEYLSQIPEDEQALAKIKVFHNLGTIYFDLGENVQSFKNFLDAIESAKAVNDTSMLILSYNNLGLAYNDTDDFKKAEYYLIKSLELAELKGDPINRFRAISNLATVYSNQGKYEKADEFYDKAEELHTKLRPDVPPVIIMHGKGNNLAKMGRYEEAEKLLLQSLAITEEMGIAEGSYYNHHVLGAMFMESGNQNKAIFHLAKAADFAKQIGNNNHLQESNKLLYEAYAQAGKYDSAFAVLKEYQHLSDSLTALNREKELANLESRLELNRQSEINSLLQEKQIHQEQQLKSRLNLIVAGAVVIILIVILLFVLVRTGKERERANAQLQQQKKDLEEANDTKTKLFAAVSHDLRTPMTSLQAILYLLKEDAITAEELKEMLPQMEVNMRRNVNVIEDLLTWSKDQLWGIKMDESIIDLQEIVVRVIENQQFMAEEKNIDIVVNDSVTADLQVIADRNSLQLVIRNLLTNGIKFSEEWGTINIAAKQDDEHVTLSIEDAGIGIPKDKFDDVFNQKSWTREGTKKEKGSGFGLSMSKEFVERMNGEIWFESEENQGTVFYIKLPKGVS